MKLRFSSILTVLLGASSSLAFADIYQLSADRLNRLDERGYFTPAVKSATYDLVNARHAVTRAKKEKESLAAALPELQKQSTEATAQTMRLRKELELYTHPEEADFDALQSAMKNPQTTAEVQLALAQAFVWSYPTDPHQAEAVQDLQQAQKELAAQQQTIRDNAAARLAASAKLVQRAQAKELSLLEWQAFLSDMSQEDLLKYLGHPQVEADDHWIYTGSWVSDPSTHQPAGLRINFNGTRVQTVVPASP